MTKFEKIKKIREATMLPMDKINKALTQCDNAVDATLELLKKEMSKVDIQQMETRTANACGVFSYVHQNRVGAMIVLACQTDFVLKGDILQNLAKDICLHIVSSPNSPKFVNREEVPGVLIEMTHNDTVRQVGNKPPQVLEKIIKGKVEQLYKESCLLEQPFVKDEKITIQQLINEATAKVGEKIEVRRFVKMLAI